MADIAIDFDGTLVEHKWPKMGEWYPGAVGAVQTLLDRGHRVFIFSVRCSPTDPMTGEERDPGEYLNAVQEVRDKLDEAGLQAVDIYTGAGKPLFHVLIDDRAIHFPSNPSHHSWPNVLTRTIIRVEGAHAV